jgi:hypothetical protein
LPSSATDQIGHLVVGDPAVDFMLAELVGGVAGELVPDWLMVMMIQFCPSGVTKSTRQVPATLRGCAWDCAHTGAAQAASARHTAKQVRIMMSASLLPTGTFRLVKVRRPKSVAGCKSAQVRRAYTASATGSASASTIAQRPRPGPA